MDQFNCNKICKLFNQNCFDLKKFSGRTFTLTFRGMSVSYRHKCVADYINKRLHSTRTNFNRIFTNKKQFYTTLTSTKQQQQQSRNQSITWKICVRLLTEMSFIFQFQSNMTLIRPGSYQPPLFKSAESVYLPTTIRTETVSSKMCDIHFHSYKLPESWTSFSGDFCEYDYEEIESSFYCPLRFSWYKWYTKDLWI